MGDLTPEAVREMLEAAYKSDSPSIAARCAAKAMAYEHAAELLLGWTP